MHPHNDTTTSGKPLSVLCFTAIALLLCAIAITIVQKRKEADAAILTTRMVEAKAKMTIEEKDTDASKIEVDRTILTAVYLQVLSLVVASLALLCWGTAIWRQEKKYWPCVISLLFLYFALQMVYV